MPTAAERAEIDQQVARILSAFDLDGVQTSAGWQAQLRDLRRILARDYRSTVRSLLGDARRQFPEFNVEPLQFDASLRARLSALGITLRMEEYARRPPLRAFGRT